MVPALPRRHPARLGALPAQRPAPPEVRAPLARCNPAAARVIFVTCSIDRGVLLWRRGPADMTRFEVCHVGCRELIQEVVNSETGILITTYEHLRRQHADLLDVRCSYPQLPRLSSQAQSYAEQIVAGDLLNKHDVYGLQSQVGVCSAGRGTQDSQP
jgi:hypothetical protein